MRRTYRKWRGAAATVFGRCAEDRFHSAADCAILAEHFDSRDPETAAALRVIQAFLEEDGARDFGLAVDSESRGRR